jgi:hypothetical protein
MATNSWTDANQRYLMAALGVVREALECHIARSRDDRKTGQAQDGRGAHQALKEAASAMPSPSALELLSRMFGLSSFEKDLLLLCAGVELDSTFAAVCAEAQRDPARVFPTFSLALAALPEPHWSALTPAAPLRRWRLIEVGSGSVLTLSLLRIDERILHYLAGVPHLDERLAGLVEPLHQISALVSSHDTPARQIVSLWSQLAEGVVLPIVQLCGKDSADNRAIAVAACAAMDMRMNSISAQSVPTGAGELDGLIRLWDREAVLTNSALLLECQEMDPGDAARASAVNRLIERLNSPLIISTIVRMRATHKPILTLDVQKPSTSEQREIWQRSLSAMPVKLNGQVNALVSQFSLNQHKVRAACAAAMARQLQGGEPGPADDFGRTLWDACRIQARPRLDDLAQRIEPAATWADLVLPELQLHTLHEIALQVRQRMMVYESWGFAAKCARGLGISALFAGISGTGKTMAAEVLANEMRLDLYRIDLSAVVSKYIGETEKNLRRVFDAAEEGGAILLFDEADALFGKRSEVKDSHDRYANIEVSYLLQRMEAYRGLAILTTNLKSALDQAFLRRIRFTIHFPFPDAAQRAEIWRRIFPLETPTENLDAGKLAQLNVAGGNIRNIALNAAFLAADADEPVRMTHLRRAAQSEYTKLEKSLTEAEIGGWV